MLLDASPEVACTFLLFTTDGRSANFSSNQTIKTHFHNWCVRDVCLFLERRGNLYAAQTIARGDCRWFIRALLTLLPAHSAIVFPWSPC